MVKNHIFKKLVPILYVSDLDAEIDFYINLGFHVSDYRDEFPGFVSVEFGNHIQFGMEQRDGFDATKLNELIIWQFETNSLKAIKDICTKNGYLIVKPPTQPKEDFPCFEIKIKSPNGYHVQIEAGKDDIKE